LNRSAIHSVGIRQDLGRFRQPAVGDDEFRPERRRRVQPPLQDLLQAAEECRPPLFGATRSRLAVMADNRCWSRSPPASSGG